MTSIIPKGANYYRDQLMTINAMKSHAVASGQTITFSQSGIVQGGHIHSSSVAADFNHPKFRYPKSGRPHFPENMISDDYCDVRRGGPRSVIFCEVPKGVPHEVHAGRSVKSIWYHWKGKDV